MSLRSQRHTAGYFKHLHPERAANYQVVEIPVDLNEGLWKLPKAIVEEYYTWFLTNKESRLKLFCELCFGSGDIIPDESKWMELEVLLNHYVAEKKRHMCQAFLPC